MMNVDSSLNALDALHVSWTLTMLLEHFLCFLDACSHPVQLYTVFRTPFTIFHFVCCRVAAISIHLHLRICPI